MAAAQLARKAPRISRMSSGSSCPDIGVEPTRSTNITVTERRSATTLGWTPSSAAWRGGSTGAGCRPFSSLIALRRRLRSPSDNPSSLRSASLSSCKTSQSTPFSAKLIAWPPRPIRDSQLRRSSAIVHSAPWSRKHYSTCAALSGPFTALLLTQIDAKHRLTDRTAIGQARTYGLMFWFTRSTLCDAIAELVTNAGALDQVGAARLLDGRDVDEHVGAATIDIRRCDRDSASQHHFAGLMF